MTSQPKIVSKSNCHNLTKCDRCIFNWACQLSMQSSEDAVAFGQEYQTLTQIKQVFDCIGAVVVNFEGQIQFITQKGKQLLDQYFSLSSASYSLPEPLKHWFECQISLLKSERQVADSLLPLYIEQAERQLIVRLVPHFVKEQYFLLLAEEKLECFSISSLKQLGLTQREAEVLFWIAKDKSNAAIAKELNCSQGTVRKHIENLHRKLNVQTRTAAVMFALKKLGLLKS